MVYFWSLIKDINNTKKKIAIKLNQHINYNKELRLIAIKYVNTFIALEKLQFYHLAFWISKNFSL